MAEAQSTGAAAPAKPKLTTRVVLPFGDGRYPFQLMAKQVEELQVQCGSPKDPLGIGAIATRVFSGAHGIRETRETIRLGLIGGGMSAPEAKRLTEFYTDGVPLAEPPGESPNDVARLVLEALLFGVTAAAETPEPA